MVRIRRLANSQPGFRGGDEPDDVYAMGSACVTACNEGSILSYLLTDFARQRKGLAGWAGEGVNGWMVR